MGKRKIASVLPKLLQGDPVAKKQSTDQTAESIFHPHPLDLSQMTVTKNTSNNKWYLNPKTLLPECLSEEDVMNNYNEINEAVWLNSILIHTDSRAPVSNVALKKVTDGLQDGSIVALSKIGPPKKSVKNTKAKKMQRKKDWEAYNQNPTVFTLPFKDDNSEPTQTKPQSPPTDTFLTNHCATLLEFFDKQTDINPINLEPSTNTNYDDEPELISTITLFND